VHDDRDPPDRDRTPVGPPARGPTPPSLVLEDGHTVGFLDAPDADPAELVDAVLTAFGHLADDAVLTVHSRLPDPGTVLPRMSADHIAVIGSISHPTGGTTVTVRRHALTPPSNHTERPRPR
jgi:hypothetical protein